MVYRLPLRYQMRPVALDVMMLLACLSVAAAARADGPQVLLHKYKCDACHSNTEARTGPAFVDVAARYRGNSTAMAALTAVIKDGQHGGGPWHMPPHPEVTTVDARSMARYILSMRK